MGCPTVEDLEDLSMLFPLYLQTKQTCLSFALVCGCACVWARARVSKGMPWVDHPGEQISDASEQFVGAMVVVMLLGAVSVSSKGSRV